MYKDIDKAVKRIQELEQLLEEIQRDTNGAKVFLENPWDIPTNDKSRNDCIEILDDIYSNVNKTIWR